MSRMVGLGQQSRAADQATGRATVPHMSINIPGTQLEFALLQGNQSSDPVGPWWVEAPERFSLGTMDTQAGLGRNPGMAR